METNQEAYERLRRFIEIPVDGVSVDSCVARKLKKDGMIAVYRDGVENMQDNIIKHSIYRNGEKLFPADANLGELDIADYHGFEVAALKVNGYNPEELDVLVKNSEGATESGSMHSDSPEP